MQPPNPFEHNHGPGCGCRRKRPPLIVILYIVVRFIIPHLIKELTSRLVSHVRCLCLNVVSGIKLRLRGQVDTGNCMECLNHRIVPDRHPVDPYRATDRALLCKLDKPTPPVFPDRVKPPKMRFKRRIVACACRNMDELRNESATPEWCPLKGK